jgi:hypothetical protein
MDRDHFSHPFRARHAKRDGDDWDGHFLCGENPYLYARRVERVTVEDGEALHWRKLDDAAPA